MLAHSPSANNIKIVDDYWLRAASRELFIYYNRVESKSNISDDPSRLNVEGNKHKGNLHTAMLGVSRAAFPKPRPHPVVGGTVWVRRLWEALFARMAVAHSNLSVHIRPDARRA